jgi:hypothetical protein
LTAPGLLALKLKYDEALSDFAFNLNVRLYFQAFRHLYALAARTRLLQTVDAATRRPVYAPIELTVRPAHPTRKPSKRTDNINNISNNVNVNGNSHGRAMQVEPRLTPC